MSLGEQRRVAVARVVARPFGLLLADEPTSSLDEKNAHQLAQLLLSICVDKTLIVVSLDQRIEKYIGCRRYGTRFAKIKTQRFFAHRRGLYNRFKLCFCSPSFGFWLLAFSCHRH